MRKKRFFRAAARLAALCLTALLALAAPDVAARIARGPGETPPGASRPDRQLVTVWLMNPLPGAAAWLQKQAAALSARQSGLRVWVRLLPEAAPDALPDLAVFSADTALSAEGFGPARPVCLSGYALLTPDETRATPAPKSLLGLPPRGEAASPAPAAAWPERFCADGEFGLLALAALGDPPGAAVCGADEALRRFLAGESALLSLSQARQAAARGAAYRVAAAAPATDLLMYAALREGAPAEAEALLRALCGEEAQTALAAYGLIPARPGLHVYGADSPAEQAVESALQNGTLAPAFTWPARRAEILSAAQALRSAGQSAASLLGLLPPSPAWE